jgi:hypothetical protein
MSAVSWGQPSPSPLWLPHSNPKLWALEAPVLALVHETTSAPMIHTSVADPNPDPHVFGSPGSRSGSISQRYGSGSGSGSGSFYPQAKKVRKTLIPNASSKSNKQKTF